MEERKMELSQLTHASVENSLAADKTLIYVGNLNSVVTEGDVMKVFSSCGPPISVMLYRKAKSPSFAYVKFHSEEQAMDAMREMNHFNLCGLPMRIMPVLATGNDFADIIDANVFVKKLHHSIDAKKLEEIFSAYGTVVSCKVSLVNGWSRGYGFVQFSKKEEADAAINSKIIAAGNELHVSRFLKKSERRGKESVCNNLYVKNLDYWITDDYLREKFSKFGKVRNAVVMRDEYGKSKMFGFVSFFSPQETQKAMAIANGLRIGSKKIYVGVAQKKAERQKLLRSQIEERLEPFTRSGKMSRLYFLNVNANFSELDIRKIFNGYGKVQSLSMFQSELQPPSDNILDTFQYVNPRAVVQYSTQNIYPNIHAPHHYWTINDNIPDFGSYEVFNYYSGINHLPHYRY